MDKKIPALKKLYASFAEKTQSYRQGQACQKSCGFCCSDAGTIDITTLEGLQIQRAMDILSRNKKKPLIKRIRKEIRKREKGQIAPCPFLLKNSSCLIYDDRPFSCRRIYSNHRCTKENPPEVHRQVMALAQETVKSLQELDSTGYSGHISYILFMLNTPAFVDTYLKGGFKPEAIMDFGKTHRIAINKMMVESEKI